MCGCFSSFGPPFGIPIPKEIHDQFPDNVKTAWVTFDAWWKEASSGDEPVSMASMPLEIKGAMNTIMTAPIPEHEGLTGADSCYINGVLNQMVD